jgi:hypothetical protein
MNGPQILLRLLPGATSATDAFDFYRRGEPFASVTGVDASSFDHFRVGVPLGYRPQQFIAAAGGAVSGVGTTTQAAQTAAATGKERFIATATTSQAAQTSAGTGLERFIAAGTTAQAVAVMAATSVERFIAVGSTTQAAQATAGSGTVASTGITGTAVTAQAAQTAAGVGLERFIAAGATTQAAQTMAATGSQGVIIGTGATTQAPQSMAATGAVSGGVVVGHAARGYRVIKRPVPVEVVRIAGYGETEQEPRRMRATGTVTESEDWFVLDMLEAA